VHESIGWRGFLSIVEKLLLLTSFQPFLNRECCGCSFFERTFAQIRYFAQQIICSMKLIFTSLLPFVVVVCFAQPQITSANLPDANDVLVTRGATLLTAVDLEFTGPNQTWTYGLDILQPLPNTTETNCIDVASTPFAYQFLFNNPFDQTHNSDFAQGLDSISLMGFTFEDVYAYFKNSNTEFSQTGLGATISGIPVPAQGNPIDIIYHLPIEYGDQDTSYSELNIAVPTLGSYGNKQLRKNVVDGWGTLELYGLTFPVLRVRTELTGSDTVFVDSFGFGFAFERPLTVEYKWLCPAFKVPALQITTTSGVVSSVETADVISAVNEKRAQQVRLFPNPTSDFLRVDGNGLIGQRCTILDAVGRSVWVGTLSSGSLDVSWLPAGGYFIQIGSDELLVSKPFFKN
jgi:hypothetical protein